MTQVLATLSYFWKFAYYDIQSETLETELRHELNSKYMDCRYGWGLDISFIKDWYASLSSHDNGVVKLMKATFQDPDYPSCYE